MGAVDADIWVLTDTRASIAPAQSYHGLHTPPAPRRPDPDERWVSIWSRWPMRPTGLPPDPRGAVSAIVRTPDGPLLIYGTVLPWAKDKGNDGDARMWQVHYQQIERQSHDWQALRRRYPTVPLVVAGDYGRPAFHRHLHPGVLFRLLGEDVASIGTADSHTPWMPWVPPARDDGCPNASPPCRIGSARRRHDVRRERGP